MKVTNKSSRETNRTKKYLEWLYRTVGHRRDEFCLHRPSCLLASLFSDIPSSSQVLLIQEVAEVADVPGQCSAGAIRLKGVFIGQPELQTLSSFSILLGLVSHWWSPAWKAKKACVADGKWQRWIVTPAEASGISPLHSLCSCCPCSLDVEEGAGGVRVWASTAVLVRTAQSDGCGWTSARSAGSSSQSPRCKSEERLRPANPASAAGTRPPGPLTRWCPNGRLEAGPAG